MFQDPLLRRYGKGWWRLYVFLRTAGLLLALLMVLLVYRDTQTALLITAGALVVAVAYNRVEGGLLARSRNGLAEAWLKGVAANLGGEVMVADEDVPFRHPGLTTTLGGRPVELVLVRGRLAPRTPGDDLLGRRWCLGVRLPARVSGRRLGLLVDWVGGVATGGLRRLSPRPGVRVFTSGSPACVALVLAVLDQVVALSKSLPRCELYTKADTMVLRVRLRAPWRPSSVADAVREVVRLAELLEENDRRIAAGGHAPPGERPERRAGAVGRQPPAS